MLSLITVITSFFSNGFTVLKILKVIMTTIASDLLVSMPLSGTYFPFLLDWHNKPE